VSPWHKQHLNQSVSQLPVEIDEKRILFTILK
jgi:hypothetical protein